MTEWSGTGPAKSEYRGSNPLAASNIFIVTSLYSALNSLSIEIRISDYRILIMKVVLDITVFVILGILTVAISVLGSRAAERSPAIEERSI